MPTNRNLVQKKIDRQTVSDLMLHGVRANQAVAHMNALRQGQYTYTRSMYQNDLKSIRRKWERLKPGDQQDKIILALATMERNIERALDGFDNSMVEVIENYDADGQLTSMKKKKSAGDVRFLQLVANIHAERNKILGVYAPKEVAVQGDVTVRFTWDSPDGQEAVGEYKVVENGEIREAVPEDTPNTRAMLEDSVNKKIGTLFSMLLDEIDDDDDVDYDDDE